MQCHSSLPDPWGGWEHRGLLFQKLSTNNPTCRAEQGRRSTGRPVRDPREPQKQQIPLVPCKGRRRFPAHEENRLCLPTGGLGSILGKAMSTTDYWSTVKQTNKQTKCHSSETFMNAEELVAADWQLEVRRPGKRAHLFFTPKISGSENDILALHPRRA